MDNNYYDKLTNAFLTPAAVVISQQGLLLGSNVPKQELPVNPQNPQNMLNTSLLGSMQ